MLSSLIAVTAVLIGFILTVIILFYLLHREERKHHNE